jgi:phage/plasmid-like protein (TIGR03299 family)
MAHEIDFSNGQANMAYVGETPWHGLGQNLTKGAPIDQWRIEAGLNWNAKRAQILFTEDNIDEICNPLLMKGESTILYRSDTKAQLGIVSPSYKIVQPGEVLEFFRDVVARGDMDIETAGSLDGGRKVWALAKTNQDFRIMGQDKVEGYLLLATSFDGTLSTRAQFTSVRVVCNNTLQMSLKGAKGISIPHSSEFKADGVKIDLGILDGGFKQFEEKANVLANRRLTSKESMNYIMQVLTGEVDPEKLSTRAANTVRAVHNLYMGRGKGATLRSAENTAWGALNAITEYVDHEQGRNANNRFRSAQFGLGADLKNKALDSAMLLVA